MFKTHRIWLISSLLLLPSAVCPALSVGWNYDGVGDDTLNAADVAGVAPYAQSNWNNHAGNGQGPANPSTLPFALKDSTGAASGISVTEWKQKSANSYSYGYSSPTPNEKLMNSFADQEPAVTFSNIPNTYREGRYTVVVYYGNNEGPSDSDIILTGSGNDYVVRRIRTGNTAAAGYRAVGFKEETGALTGSTNYTVFTGLNDANFTVELKSAGSTNNNGFCAIQIIPEFGPEIPESTTPASPAIPGNASTGFKPWQPLTWNAGGEGELNYDVYLWADGTTKPETPTVTSTRPRFIPEAYLLPNQLYRWQIVTHLESGSPSMTSQEFTFTTGSLDGQPPFDVSASARVPRTQANDAMKGIDLLVTNSGSGYPIANNTSLAFYGDSITDVYTYFDGIKNRLQQAKTADSSFPNVTVLNRGINGARTIDLLDLPLGDRYGGGGGPNPPKPFKDQVDEDLAALTPGGIYVAVIQIGINDVYQGDNTPKATYKQRLEEMTDYVLGKGHLVVLVSPAIMNESPLAGFATTGGNGLLNQYVEALEEIGASRNVPVVDQRTAYLNILKNENVAIANDGTVTYPGTSGILLVDAVHPNSRGKSLSSEFAALGIYQAVTATSDPGEIDVTPTSLNFPGQNLGVPSTAQAITIQNTHADNALAISGVTVTGTHATDFSLSGATGGIIPPLGSLQVNVIFTPTASGVRTASLQIGSNDADESVVTTALQGTGVAVPPAAPTNPSPATGATEVMRNVSLQWAAATGATSYDVFFWKDGETAPDTPTANVATTSYTPSTLLEVDTLYRWKVTAKNSAGDTPGSTWSFRTQAISLQSIGWNYDNGARPNDTLSVSEIAGVPPFAQANWNNHLGQGTNNQGAANPGTLPFALKDNTGTPSGAEVTAWGVSSANSWSHSYTGDDPDSTLMNSFNDREPTITFSNIPADYQASGYTIVAYYGNNEGPSTSSIQIVSDSGTRSRTIRTGNTTQSAHHNIGYREGTDANTTTPTNYTVFTGFTDPEFTLSFLSVSPTSNNNNGLCAIQIVKESSTVIDPYTGWVEEHGLEGEAANFDADPDNDGLTNGIEFVIGGQPNPAQPGANSSGLLIPVETDDDHLIFTYTRTHASSALTPVVEFSDSLEGTWTTATDPGNASITIVEGDQADTVTVAIPKNGASKLFARLRVAQPSEP